MKKKPNFPKLVTTISQPPPPQPSARILQELDSRTEVNINGQTFDIAADDLESLSVLGRGAYGVVEKVRHRQTKTILAVKRITYTFNNVEERRLMMDVTLR